MADWLGQYGRKYFGDPVIAKDLVIACQLRPKLISHYMDKLKTIATDLGVKKADLDKCVSEWRYTQSVNDMMSQGYSVFGINGTPGNVIYDRETWKYQILPWAYPADNFIEIINNLKAS